MIIKRVTLENIRSYEFIQVEFPEGRTLLSGDIGAGKTSVLLAIEFGLFGLQPGKRGTSLLRNGKDSGKVILEIEVEGDQIIIERKLKKSKSITQDYCSIKINGEQKELSVIELKSKILNLLSYPEEFAKKQNLLYKFTVYTPQEEMKEIILQDSTTRLNTIRHVFGIDRYKRILENAGVVGAKIREETRIKAATISNLEEDKILVKTKQEEVQDKTTKLYHIDRELVLKKDLREKIQEEKELLSKKIEEKRTFEKEIEKTKIMLSTKKDLISQNKKSIEKIKEQIVELSSLKTDELKIKELEKDSEVLKLEKENLSSRNLEISTELYGANSKITEQQKIKEKIIHIEICPTCMQNVDANYKQNVTSKADKIISENTDKIEQLNLEKRNLIEKISLIDMNIKRKEKEISELRLMQIKLESIKEKEKHIEEIEKQSLSLEKDIIMLETQATSLKTTILEFGKYEILFEEKQKELQRTLNEERDLDIKFASLKKEIEVFQIQIKELESKIIKTEEIQKEINYLTDLENWLSKKFIPLVEHVEKNVIAKLRKEFSNFFSEWFSMLVSDSFSVRLGDDFSPVIEQQDYELDYTYLSGGERTAVALAYRLALNQVINSLMSKIKTKDLVILDEPTDGFSAQQLDKMRDVLEQLDTKQLIIVSHEQKIEGFVDNIIKLKKEAGLSQKV